MSQQTIYLALSGLSATMDRMTAGANNLANTNTTAFKAQQPIFRSEPFYGQGLPDRVDVTSSEESADFKAGPIEATGRDLDVAVKGPGWIAVQAADGSVALTPGFWRRAQASRCSATAPRRLHCRRCKP